MLPWMWELWILAFWWSMWTLADTYLIPFTPWSELVVLGVCGATMMMAVARGGLAAAEQRASRAFDKMLDGVTQTNTVGASPKSVVVDAV